MRSMLLFVPLLFVGTIAAAPPAALAATQLDVKTGLWDMTSRMQMRGAMIPPEALAQMPPAMRDKMTAMLQGMQQPHTHKSCLTEEKLENGFDVDEKTKGHCHREIESLTSSEIEFRATCEYDQHSSTVHAHFTATDRETMTGTVDVNRAGGKGPSEIHVQIDGKWLGADCGGIKE